MPDYLAELYLSETDAGGLREAAARARAAADDLRRAGRRLRFVRVTFVPADETCFVVFAADTADAVAEAGRRAGLHFDRIVAACETA